MILNCSGSVQIQVRLIIDCYQTCYTCSGTFIDIIVVLGIIICLVISEYIFAQKYNHGLQWVEEFDWIQTVDNKNYI